MAKHHLPEPVQVPMSTRGITGLSGPRATADFKAGPMRAASRMEAAAGKEFPAVFPVGINDLIRMVTQEDPVAEAAVKGKPMKCVCGPRPLAAVACPW